MGSNWQPFRRLSGEWGSKARKYKSEKAKVETGMREDQTNQIFELLGAPTGTMIDMFGLEWNMYNNSKVYYITNIGDDRDEIISWLETHYPSVRIVEKVSIFKYICITHEDNECIKALEKHITSVFNDLSIMRDTG